MSSYMLRKRLAGETRYPMVLMLDEKVRIAYPYFGDDNPIKWDEGVGDYVGVAGGTLSPSGFDEGVRDSKALRVDSRFERATAFPYPDVAFWLQFPHFR